MNTNEEKNEVVIINHDTFPRGWCSNLYMFLCLTSFGATLFFASPVVFTGLLILGMLLLVLVVCIVIIGEIRMKKEARRLRIAAELGDAEAQHRLGNCYCYGNGVPEDKSEGIRWYCKSAEQGYAPALTDLGSSYLYGMGVPKNREEVIKYFRQAAELGVAEAQWFLGKSYLYGNGVPQSQAKAMIWFHQAAEQGHEGAILRLRELENGVPETA